MKNNINRFKDCYSIYVKNNDIEMDDEDFVEDVIVFINEDNYKDKTNLEIGKEIEEFCDCRYNIVKIVIGKNLNGALERAEFIVNTVENARFVYEDLGDIETKLVVYNLNELASSKFELFALNFIFWQHGIMIDSITQGRVVSDDPYYGEIAFKMEMYHRYGDDDGIQFKPHPRFRGGYFEGELSLEKDW